MEIHNTLLILGICLLLGLVADELGRRSHIPRVTLLILLGLASDHRAETILAERQRIKLLICAWV